MKDIAILIAKLVLLMGSASAVIICFGLFGRAVTADAEAAERFFYYSGGVSLFVFAVAARLL